jgi:hypothetical protein
MAKDKATPPRRIYLQWVGVDADDATPEELATQPGRGDVTWCSDKQFDTDVEYVRADVLREGRNER